MSRPAEPIVVVGVAIGLPEPVHRDLVDRRARAGDPRADTVPPHVTLLPPTELPVAALEDAERHLADVGCRHAPFALHLSGPGTFRPVSEVVFVQVAAGLAQCERLEADVRSGPLRRSTRFPYHPHVTVAHDVPTDALDRAYDELRGYDEVVPVSAFTMFEQNPAGLWTTRREFALAGEGGG